MTARALMLLAPLWLPLAAQDAHEVEVERVAVNRVVGP